MWALYEQGELHATSELTGLFARDGSAVDATGVMQVIDDAREEAIRRELGRQAGNPAHSGSIMRYLGARSLMFVPCPGLRPLQERDSGCA